MSLRAAGRPHLGGHADLLGQQGRPHAAQSPGGGPGSRAGEVCDIGAPFFLTRERGSDGGHWALRGIGRGELEGGVRGAGDLVPGDTGTEPCPRERRAGCGWGCAWGRCLCRNPVGTAVCGLEGRSRHGPHSPASKSEVRTRRGVQSGSGSGWVLGAAGRGQASLWK